VTRHIRFRRAIDAAMRRAALEERRGFNDLVQIVVEDWLKARARLRGEALELPPPGRRGGTKPRKPPRKA